MTEFTEDMEQLDELLGELIEHAKIQGSSELTGCANPTSLVVYRTQIKTQTTAARLKMWVCDKLDEFYSFGKDAERRKNESHN